MKSWSSCPYFPVAGLQVYATMLSLLYLILTTAMVCVLLNPMLLSNSVLQSKHSSGWSPAVIKHLTWLLVRPGFNPWGGWGRKGAGKKARSVARLFICCIHSFFLVTWFYFLSIFYLYSCVCACLEVSTGSLNCVVSPLCSPTTVCLSQGPM